MQHARGFDKPTLLPFGMAGDVGALGADAHALSLAEDNSRLSRAALLFFAADREARRSCVRGAGMCMYVRGACVRPVCETRARRVCATRVRDACVRRVFARGGEAEVVGTTHWLAMLMAMKLAGVDGLGARRTRRTP